MNVIPGGPSSPSGQQLHSFSDPTAVSTRRRHTSPPPASPVACPTAPGTGLLGNPRGSSPPRLPHGARNGDVERPPGSFRAGLAVDERPVGPAGCRRAGLARREAGRIPSRRARIAQAGPGARRSVSRRPTPFRSRPRTSCPGPRRPAGATPVIPGRVPRCGDPPAAGRRHPLRRPPAVRGTATRQARGGGAVPDRVRSSGAGGRGLRILTSSEHPGRPTSPMRPIGAGARGARSIYRKVGCPNLLQRPRSGRSVGRESLIFRASSRGRSRRGTSLWQIWTRPRPGPSQEPHPHHPAPAHPRRRNDAGPTDRRAQ